MFAGINGSPPFFYSTDFFTVVEFHTDPGVVASLLPPPLQAPESGLASLTVVRHRLSPMGPYTGVYLSVAALRKGEPVRYMVSGLKTTFSGVVGGREIFGMPLQMGLASAEWNGELFEVRAGRSLAVPFVELTLQLDTRGKFTPSDALSTYVAPKRDFEESKTRLLVGGRMAVKLDRGELWSAKARLKINGGTPRDDWSALPVLEVRGASYLSGADLELPVTQILDTWEEV